MLFAFSARLYLRDFGQRFNGLVLQQIHNAIDARRHNATVAIKDEEAERRLGRWGATDRNRVTLFGSLETIQGKEAIKTAEKAFAKSHKDAIAYFPGKGPHVAYWATFKVERIYWVGGFGE